MTRYFIIGISIFIIILLTGCTASDPTLATVGGEKILLSNYENKFSESNSGWDSSAVSSVEERREFLDLLVKFKLKVKEAYARGLDKDSVVVSEMDFYSNSVPQPYMLEKEVIEPGVKKLYEMKRQELRVSHILLRIQKNASPEDTQKVYSQAMNIIEQIPHTPFDTLAVRYSEDPTAKKNYGDLGFFTAGRMVPEFENACYSLKPGEYTKKPVRTQFGYHIIVMKEKKAASGPIRLSHILLRFNESLSDTAAVRDTAWLLYRQLKNGASFTELAKKYSKDIQNASKGGDLGFFERTRLVPHVGNLLYNLNVDSVTEPMGFNYGYHIFCVTEKKKFPDFKEAQENLKKEYQQTRYQNDHNKYVERLKTKYNVQIDSAVVSLLISSIDTNKTAKDETWKDTLSADMMNSMPIKYSDGALNMRDFVKKVTAMEEYRNYRMTPSNTWMLANKAAESVALERHARNYAKSVPLLAQLLNEYKEGTLLQRIEQNEVWEKIVVNDSLLKEYYNLHKDNYRWPVRVNFAEIYLPSDSLANAVYKKINKGMDFLNAAEKYTDRPGYKEKKGVWGFQVFNSNDLSLRASKMEADSVTAPFKFEKGWSIIKVLGKDSAQVKTFEEAVPEITSAYQEEAAKTREAEWVKSLEKKYTVTVNQEVLINAFKKKRADNR
ncbi:MAG: peptidylprolyl isomerase [Bacteroidetes bacterium]|nr:peptidylprolyl isomerase [Bacteroidota bacterium]